MYKKLTIICANSHFNVVFLTEIIILFVHLQACRTLLFCIVNALVINFYSEFCNIPSSQNVTTQVGLPYSYYDETIAA